MTTLICTTVSLTLLWRLLTRRAEATKSEKWRDSIIMLGAAAIAALAWPGGMVMRKVLAELAMPCGILWLLWAGLSAVAWRVRQRKLAAGMAASWLIFSLAGNAWVVVTLFGWLERDYAHIDPRREGTFDAVIVLGGATDTAPSGNAQLTLAGDRVRLGAALYLNRQTQRLVCTGRRIEGVSDTARDAAEEVAELWQELGIPAGDITQLSGRTTGEEMVAIRTLLAERQWQRVGLVTSAWHMRRAQRLASDQGMQLEPLPADFIARRYSWTGLSVIPDGAALLRTHYGCKELLAELLRQ